MMVPDRRLVKEKGSLSERYISYWQTSAPQAAIKNVTTQMYLLFYEGKGVPISVNEHDQTVINSYVVSPFTAFTGYTQFELQRIKKRWVAYPALWVSRLLEFFFMRAQLDRMVQVNNWLVSTIVYPIWEAPIQGLTEQLIHQYPMHSIAFRSINRFSNKKLLTELRQLGFLSIPSRQVYIYDAREGERSVFLKHHNVKMDGILLKNTKYKVEGGDALSDADYQRMESLYNMLYVEKYCPLNPQYTADWMRVGQQDGWLDIRVLRSPQGCIDGVLGWIGDKTTFTAPLFGYDTSLPQDLGLYRLLVVLCFQEAVRRKCILNLSSGAAHFKRMRGRLSRNRIQYGVCESSFVL